MDEDYERDEDLKDRQGGRMFRVGRVLRGTFDERPDAVLEPRITRLMLDLTHLPYGDEAASPSIPPAPVRPAEPASLLRRLASRWSLR